MSILYDRTEESTVNGDMIYYVIRGLENAGDALEQIVPKGFPGMCVATAPISEDWR